MKRNITSTQNPITPTLKEPIIEVVLAKKENITITPSATPSSISYFIGTKADTKSAKKYKKSRKKKIEKVQKVVANITRRLNDIDISLLKFDSIIKTLRAR